MRELASATSVAKMAEILKRTALVAYPRADVASLSGSAWSQWLAATGGQEAPVAVVESLQLGVFSSHDPANATEVAVFAADWIQNHRVLTNPRKHHRRHDTS